MSEQKEETTAEALARLRARKAEMTAGAKKKKAHARPPVPQAEKKRLYARVTTK